MKSFKKKANINVFLNKIELTKPQIQNKKRIPSSKKERIPFCQLRLKTGNYFIPYQPASPAT